MKAAFKASVHGFRTIPSRGVLSITIEAPIEEHAEIAAIAIHGAWVAVARLEETEENPAKATKEKKKWDDLLPSAQAAIRCDEPSFKAFLVETLPGAMFATEGNVAETIRVFCGVASRKDLNIRAGAKDIWHKLDKQYLAWKAVEHA